MSDLNNVTVNFASPPPGTCTPSQAQSLVTLLNGLVSADITATGNTSFYNFGDATPTAENRIYPWLKTISGVPDNWYVYVNGAWTPVNPQRIWYSGTAGGVANAYTATTYQQYPSTVQIQVGDVFLVKIPLQNTGPTTLSINGFPAAAVQSESLALVGSELVPNETYIFMWDGTYFRLLNATPIVQPVALTKKFDSGPIPIGAAGTTGTPIPHGLLTIPLVVYGVLRCTSVDVGAAVDQEIPLQNFLWHTASGDQDSNGPAIVLLTDSVNVTPLWNYNDSGNLILYKTVGSTTWTAIDTSKWVLVFRAFA